MKPDHHPAMEPMKMKHSTSDEDLFNELMEHVGMEGKFQSRFNYLYNMALMVLVAMPALNIILALTSPDHWCHVPGRNETNFTLSEWKTLTVPRYRSFGETERKWGYFLSGMQVAILGGYIILGYFAQDSTANRLNSRLIGLFKR
jgi:hypothetical protein